MGVPRRDARPNLQCFPELAIGSAWKPGCTAAAARGVLYSSPKWRRMGCGVPMLCSEIEFDAAKFEIFLVELR